MKPAKLPGMHPLHRLLKIGDTAALRAGLEDPLLPMHGVGQLPTGGDGDATRLLAIDVLASFRGQDGGRCVPAVAGRDQHGIDILAVEQVTEVAVKNAVLIPVVIIGLAWTIRLRKPAKEFAERVDRFLESESDE